MDETYLKVKSRWAYLYRAVDKYGKALDFMLSEQRDEAAATAFFKRTIENNGVPEKGVIDKSGPNQAGLLNVNVFRCQHGIEGSSRRRCRRDAWWACCARWVVFTATAEGRAARVVDWA